MTSSSDNPESSIPEVTSHDQDGRNEEVQQPPLKENEIKNVEPQEQLPKPEMGTAHAKGVPPHHSLTTLQTGVASGAAALLVIALFTFVRAHVGLVVVFVLVIGAWMVLSPSTAKHKGATTRDDGQQPAVTRGRAKEREQPIPTRETPVEPPVPRPRQS